jgi:hypothetical protein
MLETPACLVQCAQQTNRTSMQGKFLCQVNAHSSSHIRVSCVGQQDLFAPELKQDNPLDLSILLSGGKEINKDYLSKGD